MHVQLVMICPQPVTPRLPEPAALRVDHGFVAVNHCDFGTRCRYDAYAAMRSNDGIPRLYAVNLLTGKAASLGAFAPEDAPVDIAVRLNQR